MSLIHQCYHCCQAGLVQTSIKDQHQLKIKDSSTLHHSLKSTRSEFKCWLNLTHISSVFILADLLLMRSIWSIHEFIFPLFLIDFFIRIHLYLVDLISYLPWVDATFMKYGSLIDIWEKCLFFINFLLRSPFGNQHQIINREKGQIQT